jgi:Protein of unknown function (DUF1064)
MSMHWSEEQLREVMNRRDRRNIPQARVTEIATLGGKARANKYRNEPTFVDGIRFPSKKEAQYYQQLLLLKAAGEIRGFTRQVSLPLASGKRRAVIDFMVVPTQGVIRFVDCKGYTTVAWAIKKDELEHSLGITIETV